MRARGAEHAVEAAPAGNAGPKPEAVPGIESESPEPGWRRRVVAVPEEVQVVGVAESTCQATDGDDRVGDGGGDDHGLPLGRGGGVCVDEPRGGARTLR